MSDHGEVSRWVLIRDLLIFQLKLSLDSFKDLFLSPLALGAVLLGLVIYGKDRGKLFYRVLAIGERFDLWLNLFGAAKRARLSPDGLFGTSEAGSDTLLGKLEHAARGGDTPRPFHSRVKLNNPFAPDSLRPREHRGRSSAAPAGYLAEPATASSGAGELEMT